MICLRATVGSLNAYVTFNVIPGLLDHIEITDANQVVLTGTLYIGINQNYNFGVIGFDTFGNNETLLPAFSTTGGVGAVTTDVINSHFLARPVATTGTLVTDISGIQDTLIGK